MYIILIIPALIALCAVWVLYDWYTRVPFSTHYFARFHNLRKRKWWESGDAYDRYVDNQRRIMLHNQIKKFENFKL